MEVVSPRVRYLFRRCLREGIYPRTWRTARLFLLRKERRSPDSPSVYRPICLLDEIGKLFESVIAACLEAHISERVPGWHDSQYGVRRGSRHGGRCDAGEEHGGRHGFPLRGGAGGLPGRQQRIQRYG
jgi:hypothetical protein